MRNYLFKDKENLISWDIIPSFTQMGDNKKSYLKRLKKYTKSLNKWNDDDINYFITNNALGTYIEDMLNEEFQDNTACFVVNNVNLPIAVVVLSPPYDKSVTLDYIIVNEKYRGQGLATRILQSVKDNICTMLNNHSIEEISALIRADNIASQKVFIKQGYSDLKPAHDKKSLYGVYTCKLKENTNYLP